MTARIRHSTSAMAALGVLATLVSAAPASAQTVETDPLQCWWRTSTPAVRVGQSFSLVLTCAVVETDAVTVVPNQAPLDPIVMQMPPFEVLGGTHAADLRGDDHRFFQYEYRLRIVAEDAFGKDVKLPELRVAYHVQSRAGEGAAIEGRELTYVLPPMVVRVLSLVPDGETDIRDASSSTFGDVAARVFRADLLRTVAVVLFGLAALGVVMAVVRLFGRYHKEGILDAQLLPDVAILRQVGRELSSVKRERRAGAWTPALVDRLMTALRIAAAYALSRRVIQIPLTPPPGRPASPVLNGRARMQPPSSVAVHDGHLVVGSGWIHGKAVAVAGVVTAETIRQHRSQAPPSAQGAVQRAELLDDMERALGSVTLKQYERERRIEDHVLDDALEVGDRTVRRVTPDYTWLGKRRAAIGRFWSQRGSRAWTN